MTKKNAIQIVGIALAVFGFYDLYRDVYLHVAQVSGLTAELFPEVFVAIIYCLIAIYGGIQLVRLQEVGRKLAAISFFWILFVIMTRQFPDYWSGKSPYLEPVHRKYLILILSIYSVYILAFVSLLNHKAIELMSKNDYLLHRIGRVLSVIMPGLGRALTENLWVGMVLFICYLYLMRVVFSRPDLTTIIFLGFVTWRIFSFIDSAAVKKAFEA